MFQSTIHMVVQCCTPFEQSTDGDHTKEVHCCKCILPVDFLVYIYEHIKNGWFNIISKMKTLKSCNFFSIKLVLNGFGCFQSSGNLVIILRPKIFQTVSFFFKLCNIWYSNFCRTCSTSGFVLKNRGKIQVKRGEGKT